MDRSIFFYSWLLLSLFLRFGVCSLFGDAVLYVLSNFTIIPLGKRDMVALRQFVLNFMSTLLFSVFFTMFSWLV